MVRGLDDAQRGPVLAAGQGPGVAMGQDADRALVRRRQDLQPEARQAAVIGGGLEDDRVCFLAHRPRDREAVLRQLVELGVAGQDALDRPAQVDRGRPRVDQRIGAATQRRLARVRPAIRLRLGAHREPDRGDLADRRRAAHDHLADREGHLPGRPARVLDEGIREAALVDEVEGAGILAERRPEPARAGASDGRARCPAGVVAGRSEQPRRTLGVEDDAGRLGRGLLECLGRPGDRRRGVDQLAGEGPEEPPTAHVDRGRRLGDVRLGRRRLVTGHARPLCVGRLARPGIAGGVGQSGDLDA